MKIINLSEENNIICQYLAELRDVNVQNDRMRSVKTGYIQSVKNGRHVYRMQQLKSRESVSVPPSKTAATVFRHPV